jgi:hypothetical protein
MNHADPSCHNSSQRFCGEMVHTFNAIASQDAHELNNMFCEYSLQVIERLDVTALHQAFPAQRMRERADGQRRIEQLKVLQPHHQNKK